MTMKIKRNGFGKLLSALGLFLAIIVIMPGLVVYGYSYKVVGFTQSKAYKHAAIAIVVAAALVVYMTTKKDQGKSTENGHK